MRRGLSPAEVRDWFAKNGATMIVALESGRYFDKDQYIGESENVFFNAEGTERLSAHVSYEDGCPTCGGAYIKDWVLWTEAI